MSSRLPWPLRRPRVLASALVAGVLAWALIATRGLPRWVAQLVLPADHWLEIVGGITVTVGIDRVDPSFDRDAYGRAPEVLEQRARARFPYAFRDPHTVDPVVIRVFGVRAEDASVLEELLSAPMRLEFRLADDDAEARRCAWVRADDAARARGIVATDETWTHEESGLLRHACYLRAPDAATLRGYLDDHAQVPELALGADVEMVLERVVPRPENALVDAIPYVRSYAAVRAPVLAGADIAEAQVSQEPTDGRPIVVVTFTSAGAEDFADFTATHTGDKLAIVLDGAVLSAPVIQSPIRGGHAMITMGAGDRFRLQEDARNLAAALSVSEPLPLGLRATSVYTPGRGGLWRLHALRWGLIALAAALAAALAMLLGRLVRGKPFELGVGAARGRREQHRPSVRLLDRLPARLAVTAAAIAVMFAGERIRLPGISADGFQFSVQVEGTAGMFSPFALGLSALVLASVLVELVVLAVPRWRPLRHGGLAGRARLALPVAVLTVLLAALQAWLIARWIGSYAAIGAIDAPSFSVPLAALSLVAGTLVLIALAQTIDRFGVGNGYLVLLLAAQVRAHGALGRLIDLDIVRPGELVAVALTVAALTVCTTRTRIWLTPTRAARLPLAGTVPLQLAAAALGLIVLAAVAGITIPAWLEWRWETTSIARQLGWVLPVALVLALWASRGAPLRRLAVTVAISASLGYLVALLALDRAFAIDAAASIAAALGYALATAIALDLASEVSARIRHGSLALVEVFHDVDAADAAADALAAAGIPSQLRGLHSRALLRFVGPFVPVTLQVPPAHVAAAAELLYRRARSAAA